MEFLTVAAITSPPDPTPWLTPVLGIVVAILAGGGFWSLFRLRHDKKLGVAQQEVEEEDAQTRQWTAILAAQSSIVKAQAEELIAPLRVEVAGLRSRLEAVEATLKQTRIKYRHSVGYIRDLLRWIELHMPDKTPSPPPPPADVAEDI